MNQEKNEPNVTISGYTCPTCQKVFKTEEEFKNRHKKKKKN